MDLKEFFKRIGDKIKDIYYAGEEKWYKTLDRIDEHVPVYKIIDRVDEVVPSFALFLVLIFVLIILFLIMLSGTLITQEATLILTVEDSTGNSIANAELDFASPINDIFYSNQFGQVEDIIAPLGTSISLIARHNNSDYEFQVKIDEKITYETITLPIEVVRFDATTLRFLTATGALITEEINATFSCTNPEAIAPNPQRTTNGTMSVGKPSNCGTLSVTALSNNYEINTYNLTQPPNNVYMNEVLGTMSRVTVNLTSEETTVQENIPVYAYRASNPYSTDFSTTSSNGQAIFNLPAGDFYIKTNASQGYKSAESELISISDGVPETVNLELEKAILGIIKIRVEEGTQPIEGIQIALKKGTSEILSKESDSNGEALFEVEETGPFNVLITSDDYCPEYADAVVGENTIIKIKRSDGTCGYTLKTKVYDAQGKPVQYAKVLIFGENEDGIYKVGYLEKITDYNGEAVWNNIPTSEDKYKVFAYKAAYGGWSNARIFDSSTQDIDYEIELDIPFGNVNVSVKDRDNNPIQFAEVQLFDSYAQDPATGIRLVEDASGIISFNIRADKRIYAVIKADDYESHTTLPKQIIGDGTINFEATLSKPPIEEVKVEYLGTFKDDRRVLSVEAGKDYEAKFAITAPLPYQELGFYLRVGNDDFTKTELDKIYIKEMIVPGQHVITTGASYNPPTGYNTDSKYLNLEEAKWTQIIWREGTFVPGKIIVGATVRIKSTAQENEILDLAYRAWGVDVGSYERSPVDETLGTARSNSSLQELYAKTFKAWISTGDETLCDDKFCITSRYTNSDGFTQTFDTSFDAENNANYDLYLKILNGSTLQEDSFYNASVKLENKEENIDLGPYALITPNNSQSTGNIPSYETDWLSTPNFIPGSEITFTSLKTKPEKEGTGSIKMRIRDGSRLIYEKEFSLYISATKKFKLEFMKNSEFGTEMPVVPSGKENTLTVKVFNTANNLEVSEANVKLFDRFGTKIYEKATNTIGVATIIVPASLPGEKLLLKIERVGYQTLEHPFNISKQVVEINPTNLSFTVNPQTQKEDIKQVKISNNTGLDLTIENIELTGKFYGLLSESQISSWFTSFKGTIIKSNDYEEINFKIISAENVKTAEDLDATFTITLRNGTYSWTEDIEAKIRVGLGRDVDDPNCLEISKNSWEGITDGREISVSFDVTNNCTVDGQLVGLNGLSAKNNINGNNVGRYGLQSGSAFTDLSTAYYKTVLNKIGPGETIPMTVKFVPFAGVNSTATGTISIRALNETDSQNQQLLTGMDYSINITNLKDCLIIGSDLVRIDYDSSASFSIQNDCPVPADITIDSKLTVSNKTFTINAGNSQEVTITRYEEDLPGAYNILVYGRQTGNTSQLLGNVKAILDPKEDECIRLSRYEFDLYDSLGSDTDGFDTATLSNHCLTQNVSIGVSGTEKEDWSKIWTNAAIGALAGWATCKSGQDKSGWQCLDDGLVSGWFDRSEKNVSKNVERARKTMSGVVIGEATKYSAKADEETAELAATIAVANEKLTGAKNDSIATTNASFDSAKTALSASPYSGEVTTTEKIDIGRPPDDDMDEAIRELEQEQTEAAKEVLEQAAENVTVKVNVSDSDPVIVNNQEELNIERQKALAKIDAEYNTKKGELNKLAEEYGVARSKFVNVLKDSADTVNAELKQRADIRQVSAKSGAYTNEQLEKDLKEDQQYAKNKLKSDFDNARKTYQEEANRITEKINDFKATLDAPSINVGVETIPGEKREVAAKVNKPEINKPEPDVQEPGTEQTENGKPAHAEKEMITSQVTYEQAETRCTELGGTATTVAACQEIMPEWNMTGNEKNFAAVLNNGGKICCKTLKETDPPKCGSAAGMKTPGTLYASTEDFMNKNENNLCQPSEAYTAGSINCNINSCEWKCEETSCLAAQIEIQEYSETPPQAAGIFLLASGLSMNNLNEILVSGALGAMGNNALVGGLLAGLTSWLQEQDKTVQYHDSGSAELMNVDTINLDVSQVGLNIGDITYGFGDVTIPEVASTTSGWTSSEKQEDGQRAQQGASHYQYDSSYQTATQGLIEKRKLTFVNNGFVTDSPYNPLEGILSVNGTVKTYENQYDFGEVGYDFDANNLKIAEEFELEQQFHLLFNSWEYEDVPIQIDYVQSCTVGQKTGATGADAVPKLALEWDWQKINEDTCDEDNPNYVYCDSTQFTISLLKKVTELKNFFQNTSLPNCPQAIDVAGTKSQTLKENSIDVGITRIWMEKTNDGARINATVQSNNQLEMDAIVEFNLTQAETIVPVNCSETKTFISSMDYSCEVESSQIGTGAFNVSATMIPQLCTGCENNYTGNDTISSTLILGSETIQACEAYNTESNNFQNVLVANNINTTRLNETLGLIEFNTNLVKDGFSNDFKSDFDAFSMQVANAPVSYTTQGLRELFLSEKFKIEWPQKPGAWSAGKYSVNVIVEFEEDSWNWTNDNNNIKSITVQLDPWGNPDPYYAIYDVAFNGPVGLDNERNGYGSNYTQMTEKAFQLTNNITANPNPSNNAVSNAIVSIVDDFYTINNVNRGNVLTISRSGNDVKLDMSPSVPVPLILNISRNSGRDAFAYYSVEVDGQPQTTGSYLMTWSGIGGNCVDFQGQSMLAWQDSLDQPASETTIGSMGSRNAYGMAWENAVKSGTVSLYGMMFTPAGKSSVLSMSSSGDSAGFEGPHGAGQQITINPYLGISNLKDVFDKVKSEEICVVDGRDYFWNTEPYLEGLNIESKESNCITN